MSLYDDFMKTRGFQKEQTDPRMVRRYFDPTKGVTEDVECKATYVEWLEAEVASLRSSNHNLTDTLKNYGLIPR